jgi:hypothetical protein
VPCRITILCHAMLLHFASPPRPSLVACPILCRAAIPTRLSWPSTAAPHSTLARHCQGLHLRHHHFGTMRRRSSLAGTCFPQPTEDTTAGRSACCKHMFQVFQIFQRYVASVSDGCCKSRSGCCTCCNVYIGMLQALVPNVSSIFRTHVTSVFT